MSSEIQKVMHRIAELALVVEQALELVETPAGPLLDERPPQIDELLRGRRRRLAGQPLADHHGDGLLDRRIGTIGDLVKFAAVETVVDHGGQIVLHAKHAAGADRLDASLLDGVEDRASLLAARQQTPMHRRIVAGKLEGDESAWPRTIAASPRVSLRAGSGNFTLPPTKPGRSAANEISSSDFLAIARRQVVTALLKGSVGNSLLGVFGFWFDDIADVTPGFSSALR